MNKIDLQRGTGIDAHADLALKIAVGSWFVIAAIGLWLFAAYVTVHYVGSAFQGNLEAWNQVFPRGYIPGETLGNLAVGAHVFIAAVIIAGGPLQLIPQIRSRFSRFHRWNGRVFLTGACVASLAGLYLVWIRGGTSGSIWQHLGITLDAILILVFAVFALRYAMARNITAHQRWALRLFLVVNAVWFLRIGLMAWLFIHQAPVGFDPQTFTGPFLNFMAFAKVLLPLLVLELYLYARDHAGSLSKLSAAIVLVLATSVTAIGVLAATMNMWLPYF